jgi:hypothetical protein
MKPTAIMATLVLIALSFGIGHITGYNSGYDLGKQNAQSETIRSDSRSAAHRPQSLLHESP